MSTILTHGNVFETVEEFTDYVVYRVSDQSLNIANYEPIYAAKLSNGEEVFVVPAPATYTLLSLQLPIQPNSVQTSLIPKPVMMDEVAQASIPEPSYLPPVRHHSRGFPASA